MKTRIAAVLILGALLGMLAGCGGDEFKPKTTGGEGQTGKVDKGVPMSAPTGMPGSDKIGK
jgi:hypothetical protein